MAIRKIAHPSIEDRKAKGLEARNRSALSSHAKWRPAADRCPAAAKRTEKVAEKTAAKAYTRDSLQALSKLAERVDGQYRIISQPPLIVPARDLAATFGLFPDPDHASTPRTVPCLPGDPAG
jgi:hypothetical protein